MTSMASTDKSRAARARLVSALRRELIGPSEPNECIPEFPTTRYIIGRLAPARTDEHDMDAAIEQTENDSLGAGADDEEAGEEDSTPPLIIGFSPSSFGISFLLDSSATGLRVHVSWGDYLREKDEKLGLIWRRYPREAAIDGIRVDRAGNIPQVLLSSNVTNAPGVTVTGLDMPEITVEGVVHEFAGYRAVSIFLVNRRTKGHLGDREKDERWLFQPKLTISALDQAAVFVAKDAQSTTSLDAADGESAHNALLYRHAREFATGHGVATGWATPVENGSRTTSVFTDFIPEFEVPLLIAPAENVPGANFDMQSLAEASTPQVLIACLEPLADAYELWIGETRKASQSADIQSDGVLREAAAENLARCEDCAQRVRAGLALLKADPLVLEAFRFANRAMWKQRIQSLWAAENRKRGECSGSPADFDKPTNRTWRPFQMGFILLNLVGIADDASNDRKLVDLLWFPTGGGKTEAYLGLSAFVLALRRLRGDRYGMHGGAGVSIIMRYTLRLLTIQQFQRASALIAACELSRRANPTVWGDEPFRVGVWVGRGTTPNTFVESRSALDDAREGRSRGGSPVQLVSCPHCGTALVNEKGVPERDTYVADKARQRTLIWCPNSACDFSAANSNRDGIPVVVVDDEIYRICPSLVIATVDKFARLPFKGETKALLGLRNRHSATYGHITDAHGDSIGGIKLRDGRPANRLLPPELIIQDELHLISGPLGTMVGLYEMAVDYLSSFAEPGGRRVGPKVIASTATIRRAAEQAHQLYARKLAIFPTPGLSSRDSFFARELPIDPNDDETAGRLYVGANAPGSSTKTLLVRVYAVLLAAAAGEIAADASAADPYGTLVGYFNSLRALGGAKRLVEDDIKLVRLKYLNRQRGLPQRNLADHPEELTSRLDSWKIPGLLKRLDNPFPAGDRKWPVDVLLATNMISVGVDIDRLGLMVVTGQPKTSAEYIQATSRIGRKHPGLVVTMYNWMSARDLSHYERFRGYHAALYKFVEAISVTPFSSRALDRGLRGVFVAMNRLLGNNMAREPDAQNFDRTAAANENIVQDICQRAALLVGRENAELVRDRLSTAQDEWAHLAGNLLRYSWINETQRPPNNTRVLLKTSGTENEGEWSAPGSLREVEPTAAFYLEEGDS